VAGYDPTSFEEKWYERWAGEGAFEPAADGEPYSIVIPPPNITGSLHMGHALNNTLQDILVRYQRMKGRSVLWVPGTDHAGIATQNVVERQLLEEKIDRNELGREGFEERTWKWKAESGGTITRQLRRLGVSCDWSRERFTLDEGLSQAVREVFVTLYERGLIKRDRYLTNWCPRCGTALSDIEVEHEERDGHLWHIRYPLENGDGALEVATTRPETMLGDTAVAVHPDDERYSKLIGSGVVLPITGRVIPIIADNYVDREFGTGALKVTPAHHHDDYEMGQRHDLEMISVMNNEGCMSEEAGDFAGMDIASCREAVVERLKLEGVLVKIDEHRLSVGTCYRCHETVEPLLSEQWFMEVRDLADRTLQALDRGETRFVPAHWEKTYRAWMENIRPWCVSRQLWWGHRIPAWYCDGCGEITVAREDPTDCPACKGELRRDEDVLDTWFSSALWPFSTMGWPESSEDLARFYPTSTLVTGFDIIFFWVARMMMMGLAFMDEVPFADVYIHALVRDEQGRKMSKSVGNVIDPLDIIDEYGADALRFTLTALAAMGRDVRLAGDRITGYRNFINKVWNAARYVEINRGEGDATCCLPESPRLVANRWIRSRLAAAVREVEEALDGYRFNDAASALYRFTWHEFCDWYIEISKVLLAGDEADRAETSATLNGVFEQVLRLLHPVVPFVTEELWQGLPADGRGGTDFVMQAAWPEPQASWDDPGADHEIGTIIEVLRAVRNIRAEMNISPSVELGLYLQPGEVAELVESNSALVQRLGRVASITVAVDPPPGVATAVAAGCELSVPVLDHVDIGAEVNRLTREISRVEKDLQITERKLANESFMAKAPPEVVDKTRARADSGRLERDTLQRGLERMRGLGDSP
jgi:valyl-tRNA synthetase